MFQGYGLGHTFIETFPYVCTDWMVFKDGADLGKPLGTDLNFGKVKVTCNSSGLLVLALSPDT